MTADAREVPDANGLWTHACLLPGRDQDFDGIGDACDLCPLAFDPSNEIYVDDDGKVWPDYGKFCNGDYELQICCIGSS